MIYVMWRFFGTSAGCSNLVLCSNCIVYLLTNVIGLCCSLETEVKIMTFELWFMRCGKFFGRERECDLGMGRAIALVNGDYQNFREMFSFGKLE